MPTYAYACKDCGHAFDIQQSFSDDSLTTCPRCSGTLRKKFNSVGVVFKGSGFYRNDSRDTKTSTDAGASSGTAPAAASASTAASSTGSANPTSTPGSPTSGASSTSAGSSAATGS
ncbi:zinc ribbon domain-containing protein [Arthrobacter agilis]|uniref:FmdB family zinc ribbon protein n=1 Tax=Arthrobacter agilis TaxID=37921 RepID=UPI0023659631|nr:FmdB family zinc ribbon protein [Arthrobacter agilis]WDF32532.1 zinc ribbon domain-containing protein [Arthrobacter agilis]